MFYFKFIFVHLWFIFATFVTALFDPSVRPTQNSNFHDLPLSMVIAGLLMTFYFLLPNSLGLLISVILRNTLNFENYKGLCQVFAGAMAGWWFIFLMANINRYYIYKGGELKNLFSSNLSVAFVVGTLLCMPYVYLFVRAQLGQIKKHKDYKKHSTAAVDTGNLD